MFQTTFNEKEITNWVYSEQAEHILHEVLRHDIIRANKVKLPKEAQLLSFEDYIELISTGQDRGTFYFADDNYYYESVPYYIEDWLEEIKEFGYTQILKLK